MDGVELLLRRAEERTERFSAAQEVSFAESEGAVKVAILVASS